MRSVKIEMFSFYGTLPLLFAYLLPMRNIYLLLTKKVCEGNVFTGVCPWEGGCIPACTGQGVSAQRVICPGDQRQTALLSQILWDTVNKRTLRILLECILVTHHFTKQYYRVQKMDDQTRHTVRESFP